MGLRGPEACVLGRMWLPLAQELPSLPCRVEAGGQSGVLCSGPHRRPWDGS